MGNMTDLNFYFLFYTVLIVGILFAFWRWYP